MNQIQWLSDFYDKTRGVDREVQAKDTYGCY